jgi:regulator of nucleoside diphosphate kinase
MHLLTRGFFTLSQGGTSQKTTILKLNTIGTNHKSDRQWQSISSEMSLSAELNRALIVNDDALPPHVIRLNSKVQIQGQDTGQIMELSIVLPQYADIKQKKVSVLTPIAAALIGFRQGELTRWKVPAGMKVFKIIEVAAP